MDGFGEIGVFVRVVEARGFTRAGKQLELTASGVSRVMSRLEERLGARLLNRTTRSLGLTPEGAAYYERCTKILHELEDANVSLAGVRAAPRGRLRVDAPSSLGRFIIAPGLPRFMEDHPELSLDLRPSRSLVDPIAEGIDVVVRMAADRQELIVKKVGGLRSVLVGSPRYLAKRGTPKSPQDLHKHDLIGFQAGGSLIAWRFWRGGQTTTTTPSWAASFEQRRCARGCGARRPRSRTNVRGGRAHRSRARSARSGAAEPGSTASKCLCALHTRQGGPSEGARFSGVLDEVVARLRLVSSRDQPIPDVAEALDR